MAKIKFTVSFKGTIEVNQKDLKLQNKHGETISPDGLSPFTIREGIEDGEILVCLSEHLDVLSVENIVADFQENSFE